MHRRFGFAVATSLAGVFCGVACDPGAVGVEDCRDIELARCRAAQHCNPPLTTERQSLGIETDEDVARCERYMRDHCMHGLEIDEEPSSTSLNRCVSAIEQAGECAREGRLSATECGLRASATDFTVCELIKSPEELRVCSFLIPDPPRQPEEDASTPPKTDGGDAAD